MNRLGLGLLLLLVWGCAGTGPVVKEVNEVVLDLEKPSIEIAPNYEFLSVSDGVSISVVPTEFGDVTLIRREIQEKSSIFNINDLITWEITDTPFIVYRPATLDFDITIQNNLDHVLRFKDAVMTIAIDGKPFSAPNVTELQQMVLVPDQSWEGKITGPERDLVPEECNIVFSIYDVVTAVDAANNPTKRTNFEWVFTYSTEKERRAVEVKRYQQKMTREQAAAFVQADGIVRP